MPVGLQSNNAILNKSTIKRRTKNKQPSIHPNMLLYVCALSFLTNSQPLISFQITQIIIKEVDYLSEPPLEAEPVISDISISLIQPLASISSRI